MSSPRVREARGERRSVRASRFARRLLAEWQRLALPLESAHLIAAVSGGADSTALLLALDELLKRERLALKLTVAYLDHGLRGTAGPAESRFVESLASASGFQFESGKVNVRERVTATGDNLEQAARRARYQFLLETAERLGARLVLTGHTLDDQAETVLLRLVRGSGAEGLSGMEPVRELEDGGDVLLVRPLVRWARRAETESYCLERGIEFRADSMNVDEKFARVRVRRRLLPLLESFNPRVVESLARTAELLREDAAALNGAAEDLLRAASEAGKSDERGAAAPAMLDVKMLVSAPKALRRRALRLWIKRGRGDLRRLELAHLAGVERLLEGERGGRVAELPGESFVERRGGRLLLRSGTLPSLRSGRKRE